VLMYAAVRSLSSVFCSISPSLATSYDAAGVSNGCGLSTAWHAAAAAIPEG
jgi:hypothetical protein